MAGTIPLIIQLPANDPINNKIRIPGMAELILLTIPSLISYHLYPNLAARIEATSAAKMSAI